MNEVVEYQNQFNKVALRGFTANELDLLIAIASKMKRQEGKVIEFEFSDLKEFVKLKRNFTDLEFKEEILRVNKKLLGLNVLFKTPTEEYEEYTQFALFTKFTTNMDRKTLKVKVNEEFYYLLNVLDKEFTRFELEEFVDLKSSYSKECYRRLKQWRKTGKWYVKIEEFRRLLSVPETYRMCDIDKWVLEPIYDELSKIFEDFTIKKIKKGRKVIELHFIFSDREIFKQQGTNFFEKNKENIEKNKENIANRIKSESEDEFFERLRQRENKKSE